MPEEVQPNQYKYCPQDSWLQPFRMKAAMGQGLEPLVPALELQPSQRRILFFMNRVDSKIVQDSSFLEKNVP